MAGGPAEELEQLVQRLFRQGSRHLIIDMQAVTDLDSAGVRALVRGHTTAQRVGGTFRLVGVTPRVHDALRLSRLDSVLVCYDSIEAASRQPFPWGVVRLAVGAVALAAALLVLGQWRLDLSDAQRFARQAQEAVVQQGQAMPTASPTRNSVEYR